MHFCIRIFEKIIGSTLNMIFFYLIPNKPENKTF